MWMLSVSYTHLDVYKRQRQAMELSDLVLVEADGSKRLPCKVPADHEPVLLPESDIVVAVLGPVSYTHLLMMHGRFPVIICT